MMSDNNAMLMAMFNSQLDKRLDEHKDSTNKALAAVLNHLAALEEKEDMDYADEQAAKKRKVPSSPGPMARKAIPSSTSLNPVKIWVSGFPRSPLSSQPKKAR